MDGRRAKGTCGQGAEQADEGEEAETDAHPGTSRKPVLTAVGGGTATPTRHTRKTVGVDEAADALTSPSWPQKHLRPAQCPTKRKRECRDRADFGLGSSMTETVHADIMPSPAVTFE
jgi:hypothetical protein